MSNYQDYADVWGMLATENAERVRVVDASLVGDGEIVRRWPDINPGYLSRCMEAINLYTDPSNQTERKWVKNPIVARETFNGIYRVVSSDVDVQKPGLKGIIQVLRKGFATSAIWAEARVVETEDGPGNSSAVADVANSSSDNPCRVLTVKFPNCSPNAIEAIAASLRASDTMSSVVVGKESYGGTWDVVRINKKIEDDGSGTVLLTLAHPQYTLNSYDNFGTERAADVHYLYDVPKPLAQGIISAWKAANPIGSSATASYSRSNGLVDIILRVKAQIPKTHIVGTVGRNCRYLETQTLYLGVESATLYPLTAPPGNGVSYERNVRSNQDGTWDIIITVKTVQYRDPPEMIIEQSAAQTTTQRQQLGLTTQAIEPMTATPGAVKTQRVEIRDDCSKDVTTNKEIGKEQTSTEITVAKSYRDEKVEKTYQGVPLTEPAQTPGFVRTVRTADSKYTGKYDTTESERKIIPLRAAVEYDVADDAAEHSKATEDIGIPNSGGLAVVLSPLGGTSLQARVEYNKDSDTLDVKKVSSVGKAQIEITQSASAGEIVTTTFKTFQGNPLSDPIATPGHIKQVKNAASKYTGKYDTTAFEKEVKPLDSVAKGGSALWDEETEVHQNAPTDMTSGATGGMGAIIDNVSRKNDAGLFDNETRKRTAKPFGPIRDVHGTPLIEETVEKSVNQDSPPNPGTPPVGTSIDVQHDINPAAKIDVTIVRRRGIPYEDGPRQTGADAFSTEQTTMKGNQAGINETFPEEKIKQVSVRVNDLKLLDATIQEKTPKTVTDGPLTIHDDLYKKTTITQHRNKNAPVASTGKGHDTSFRRNEFNKFDGQETNTTVAPFDINIEEPTTGNQAPAVTRICYGLKGNNEIQPKVEAFKSYIATKSVSHMYRISASVSRDGDGFYILTMTGNPKDSSGGGGSAMDWENGIHFPIPSAIKYKDVDSTRGDVWFTSSRTKAQQLINSGPGLLVDYGVAGKTGIYFLGRGRYKVVTNEKVS